MRKEEFKKVKELMKEYYEYAQYGFYNTKNVLGDIYLTSLNEEVQIIEDAPKENKKIKKIDEQEAVEKIFKYDGKNSNLYFLSLYVQHNIVGKINEIIDKINEELEEKNRILEVCNFDLNRQIEKLEEENKSLKTHIKTIKRRRKKQTSKKNKYKKRCELAIEYIHNNQPVFELSSKEQLQEWFEKEYYVELLKILKGEE